MKVNNNPLNTLVLNSYGNNNQQPQLNVNTNVMYKPTKPHYNVTPNSSSNTQFNSLLKAEKNQQKTNSGKAAPKYITNSVES